MVDIKMKKKESGDNYLYIAHYPEITLATTGRFVGCPVLHIKIAQTIDSNSIKLTNKQLRDYIETEHPLCDMILFSSKDDVMTHADEVKSFIRYCKSFYRNQSYRSGWWGIVTSGKRYVEDLLYELDDILIDIYTPTTGKETPPEFISWCWENKIIKEKVQFRIIVGANAKDISFVRYEVPKLGTLRCPITLQPLYWNKNQIKKELEKASLIENSKGFEKGLTQPTGWKSYEQFIDEFIDTVKYPYIRILPDLVKIMGMKK